MTNKRVALITGASSGIGRTTAQRLAAEGWAVELCARRTELLRQLEAELSAKGAEAATHTVDLSDPQATVEMVKTVHDKHGRLDALINNAGAMLNGMVRDIEPAHLLTMVDVNLRSLMVACQAAVERMATTGGDIVNISSVAARNSTPGTAGYAATKAGVDAFSRALRKELAGTGVRATIISPGIVDTELADHIPDEKFKAGYSAFMGKFDSLQAADIAEAIHFVLTRPPHVTISELTILPSGQPN